MDKSVLIIIVCAVLIFLPLCNYRIRIFIFNYHQQPSSSPSIGLFVVVNDHAVNQYIQHIHSLACYAHHHAYQFTIANPKNYPKCTKMTQSIYFQKHCLVLTHLLENVQIRWLLVVDADVLVMNLSKKIESYLPDADVDSSIHMVFYERFNGEIMAANYLIHNHPWSHLFLSRWIGYEQRIKHFTFHNFDNGALHMHLLGDMVGNVTKSVYDRCYRVYGQRNDIYHTYVGCCKCALGGRWEFEHLRILRRGHSFARDNLGSDMKKRIFSPTDFLIHGQKHNILNYYSELIDIYKCTNPGWNLPITKDIIITNFTEVKETIKDFDHAAATAYPQSIGLPDISECWPNCVDTEARRQAFIGKVCHQNALWRSY